MITVTALSRSFGEVKVLQGVDLEVGPGRVFGLLGPNGAGKTTLLKLLSCLLRPDSGEATVDGMSILQDASAIRAGIGLVPQEICMYGKLTVRENLELMGRLHGLAPGECRERADGLLALFHLEPASGRRTEHCSTGMRQALNIAMGLVHRPRVVLLDEPTEGLDPVVRRTVWDLFREMAGEGRTLLLTTHLLVEAERHCDEVAFLHAGRIRAVGTPAEVKEELAAEAGTTLEEVFLDLADEEVGHDRV